MNGQEARLKIIQNYVPLLTIPALKDVCSVVLDNKHFITGYGSAGEHHSYSGGLAVHTEEVTGYAVNMAKMFPFVSGHNPGADMNAVVVAAIFHDFMKIHEYTGSSVIRQQTPELSAHLDDKTVHKTAYRKLIRHVAGSHAEFMKAIDGKDIPQHVTIKIQHAMLAHHGKFEFGSPVEPQLIEAFILHYADMYSARFGPSR